MARGKMTARMTTGGASGLPKHDVPLTSAGHVIRDPQKDRRERFQKLKYQVMKAQEKIEDALDIIDWCLEEIKILEPKQFLEVKIPHQSSDDEEN